MCCLQNQCPLATLCYTMTSTRLQYLPFQTALLAINASIACMYVGSYVMEDIRITCSRGVSEVSPPACNNEIYD